MCLGKCVYFKAVHEVTVRMLVFSESCDIFLLYTDAMYNTIYNLSLSWKLIPIIYFLLIFMLAYISDVTFHDVTKNRTQQQGMIFIKHASFTAVSALKLIKYVSYLHLLATYNV